MSSFEIAYVSVQTAINVRFHFSAMKVIHSVCLSINSIKYFCLRMLLVYKMNRIALCILGLFHHTVHEYIEYYLKIKAD